MNKLAEPLNVATLIVVGVLYLLYSGIVTFYTDVDESNDNIPEYVDLGLSVQWATCNVGASLPEEGGDKYCWGSTGAKTYTGTEVYLPLEYDAAHIAMGDGFRTPTRDEMYELCERCKWQLAKRNGVEGFKVTGPNGNYIFIPLLETDKEGVPVINYWSKENCGTSSESSAERAYCMYVEKERHGVSDRFCYKGSTVTSERINECYLRAVYAPIAKE